MLKKSKMALKLRNKIAIVSSLTTGTISAIASLILPAFSVQAADTVGIQELIRVRCSTDGADIYTEWTGSVYSFVPQQKQRKLFGFLGMNVARCLRNKQGWFLTSRELSFYLDPQTGKVLDKWQNPWTREVVPVVHVANNPVQSKFKRKFPVEIAGSNATFVQDVFLTYPNVLASDPKFKDYSPEALYQAAELFKIVAPVPEVMSKAATAPSAVINWTRINPWLPWMKMKGKPGYLVYSATARKLLRFEDLSPTIKQEIASRRLAVYRSAPRCFLAAKNETSWSYFSKHFAEYLQRKRFPLPAPVTNERCQN